MTMDTAVPRADGREALLQPRVRQDWNRAERAFSVLLWRRIEELLEGQRNSLYLLSLYPNEPSRLTVMQIPNGIARADLRVSRVRALLQETLLFLASDGEGSPIMQQVRRDGCVVEQQRYSTRYPHIVIEREDVYRPDGTSERTTWCARRVQNQRNQTRINRWLDLANLGAEVLGAAIR